VVRESLTLPGTETYTLATLGYVLARTGRREEAEGIRATLQAQGARDYVSPVALITIHLGLEQWDRALESAERAYEERRGWLAYLKVNPLVDPLRGHPRFRALLGKMRL
jgi:hypothetical protein